MSQATYSSRRGTARRSSSSAIRTPWRERASCWNFWVLNHKLHLFTRATPAMNTPPDPFEFLKNLWGPLGLPLAGLSAGTAMSEVDKRIAELKSVETWLNTNLNVLRMT